MRALLLTLLLGWTAAAQAGSLWDQLWLTPDQRGEKLLRQGDAAAAAHTFRDPRHRAYAELLAGNYQQAAQDLASSSDGDDLYNRGNALARAGRLQEALNAYDAALRRDPGNLDAKHNRELVRKALQAQQQRPRPAAAGSSPDKNAKTDGAAAQNPSAQTRASKNQPGTAGQDKQSENFAGQQRHPGRQEQESARPQSAAQANTDSHVTDAAARARNDAATAQDALPAIQKPVNTAQAETPLNEQQLSQAQWLRQIPDDPGGLLRRKFMIEHMIRQQEAQQ